jgi:hypothetical protein
VARQRRSPSWTPRASYHAGPLSFIARPSLGRVPDHRTTHSWANLDSP